MGFAPMNLLRRFSLLGVCCTLAALAAPPAAAPDAPPTLVFARLDLTDGRKLRNVVVKSFDRGTGRLLVIADGKAMTIPLAVVPPPFNQTLQAAPASGSTVSTIGAPAASQNSASFPVATAAEQYSLSAPVAVAPAPSAPSQAAVRPATPPPVVSRQAPRRVMPQTPAPQPTANQLLAAQAGADVNAHKQAALRRAESFYRFEFRLGSDAGAVTGLNLETTTPKPVPGWEGRYRTEGKAYVEFYDSRGRSFARRTSVFEVVTEKKLGDDDLVVIEFVPKS